MNCERCKITIGGGDVYDVQGKALCEDCYMYETNPPKACDPFAVASALSIRKELGQSGRTGLSELERKIYDVIVEKGPITKADLLNIIGIKPEQLENEFAILRHCELIRAVKEGDRVYLTKW